MTAPRQTDSTPDSAVITDALSQHRPDFGAAIVPKSAASQSIVDYLKANPTRLTSGPTTGAKLSAEGELLGSLPSQVGEGLADSAKDVWQHIGRTTFETGTGLVLGAGFSLLCKNPNPIITAATTWAGRLFLGIAAVDLTARFARPMSDTWAHPERLNQDKKVLGDNVGDALLNYSVAIAGGISGASLGEKYLATTKLGTILQGYKETEISAEALGKLVSDPSDHPLGAMAKAFGRRGGNLDAPRATAEAAGGAPEQLPVSGSIRLRHMADGSQIGSTGDGSVMVLTKDGTALWFKNNRSAFGLRNKLDLTKVLHQGGDETDVLTGLYSPTTMAGYDKGNTTGQFGGKSTGSPWPRIIGRDPADYFDTPPEAGPAQSSAGQAVGREPHSTYTTIDGTKFVTGKGGAITSVETGHNRFFLDSKGAWKLGLADAVPKTSDIISLNLSQASFNLGSIPDRFETAKKGAEVGLTEIMLERAGDIGSSVFEHEVLVRGVKAAADNTP